MLSFVYFEFYTRKLLYTTNCCYFVLPFFCRSSLGCTCPSATFWKNWKPSCPQTSSINCPASNHYGNFPNKGVLSCFDWVVEKNHVNFFFLNWTVYIYKYVWLFRNCKTIALYSDFFPQSLLGFYNIFQRNDTESCVKLMDNCFLSYIRVLCGVLW